MALLEIKRDPTEREVRQFAYFWLPAFCLLVGLVMVGRGSAWGAALAVWGLGGLSIALGLSRPRWMRYVFLGWMWAAFPIGWTVSHLLLGAIYYLVITPIGLAMRLLGRDPMLRRFDRNATSYWSPRRENVDPASYFRQF
jgi:hypothetical protein